MKTSTKLQNKYNSFYEVISKYIWPIEIVTDLAELEIEIYKAFPDEDVIETKFNKLAVEVRPLLDETDKQMLAALKSFENDIQEFESEYFKLDTFKEVVSNENHKEQQSSKHSEKKRISNVRIRKKE